AEQNQVIAEQHRIPFDYLIVATGAQQAYFGHSDWAQHAPGLKTNDDAMYLRRRILLAFEKAETEPDADERRRLLSFVVVGGGATGVELTGAIAELAKRALASDFRTIDPGSARRPTGRDGSRSNRIFRCPGVRISSRWEIRHLSSTSAASRFPAWRRLPNNKAPMWPA